MNKELAQSHNQKWKKWDLNQADVLHCLHSVSLWKAQPLPNSDPQFRLLPQAFCDSLHAPPLLWGSASGNLPNNAFQTHNNTPITRDSLSKVLFWLLHSQTAPAPGVVSTDLVSAAIHYASCCRPPTANAEQLSALDEPSSYPVSNSQVLLKGNLITMISNLSLCVPSPLVVHPTSPLFPALLHWFPSTFLL